MSDEVIKKHQIFVYGTLKKEHGSPAHQNFLGGALFVGKCAIPGVLVHLGSYPGLVADEVCRVTGEIWEVSAADLQRLDQYEGCPHNYVRRQIMTPLGICWTYYKCGMPAQMGDATMCVDRGLWLGGRIDRMPYHKVLDYWKNKRWLDPIERQRPHQPVVPTIVPESSPVATPTPKTNVVPFVQPPVAPATPLVTVGLGTGVM